ncbi:progranulin-like [Haliotis rubra]|uniref:progranulin-like n=1 Tax=Haliotis rubra TaxID=36100 RepID=UPI001EE52B14|nr:progranulin-like [Haliotis rubra]
MEKTSAITKVIGDIQCDATHECVDRDPCCMMANHQWGCCPMPQAVCCPDKVHCCPSGTTCDSSPGKCNRQDGIILPWMQRSSSNSLLTAYFVLPETEASVVCPGYDSECPSGSTCCRLASGSWGCCPLPEAVCCSDNVHCCPSGMICDVSLGACIYDGISITWEYKRPARARKTQHSGGQAKHPSPDKSIKEIEASVVCPGDDSECPSGSTCCRLASGSCGCCPLPEAVCCSDNVHCCPSGMTCDVSLGACIYDGISITWEYKRPARARKTQHSGGQAKHPSPDNSIKVQKPLDNEVKESSEHVVNEILNYMFSFLQEEIEASVVCPGDESECPSGNTCCRLASGSWGCCPLPEAVCCSDNVHCCPSWMICDVSLGACIYDGNRMSWEYKRPARARKTQHIGGQAKHPSPDNNIKV